MTAAIARHRRVLVPLVVAVVVIAGCVAGFAVITAVPAYRTTLLVDASTAEADFPAVAVALSATAANTGSDDALSVRRFGGECGSADNTGEVADEAAEVHDAVGALRPSGRPTLLSGMLAAIDDFAGIYPFRGSQRNRIVVVSSTGIDACTGDQAEVSRAIADRVRAVGLEVDLDIRVVGHGVPAEQRAALDRIGGTVTYTETAAELTGVLDELVVPPAPDAAEIGVTSPAPATEPAYAFRSTTQLGVVRGDDVMTAQAESSELPVIRQPHLTTDGRFGFTASAAGVIVIEVGTGANRVLPCGDCTDAVPVGGSWMAWINAADQLWTVDLGTPAAQPTRPPVTIPPSPPNDFTGPLPPTIVAGATGAVIVAVANQPAAYGGPEDLYLISLDGTVRPLGLTDANTPAGPAVLSPDGGTVYFTTAWHSSACVVVGMVYAVDVQSATQTPLMESLPGDPAVFDGAAVLDLWFDRDGDLNAIFRTWDCPESGDSTQVLAPSQWKRSGGTWVQVDPGPVLAARPVGPNRRVVLTEPAPLTWTGSVHTEVDGKRTKIADDVLAIAVAGV